jgi:hypothetical protein
MPYATATTVSPEQSLQEVADLIQRYGGHDLHATFDHAASQTVIRFTWRQTVITLAVPIPYLDEFATTPSGKARSQAQARSLWQQETRRRHRAWKLLVQAPLEAAELGIVGIDPHTLRSAAGQPARPALAPRRPAGQIAPPQERSSSAPAWLAQLIAPAKARKR